MFIMYMIVKVKIVNKKFVIGLVVIIVICVFIDLVLNDKWCCFGGILLICLLSILI